MAQPSTSANPLSIDTQHDDMVHDAQLDYYGVKLATCSSGTGFWLFLNKRYCIKIAVSHIIFVFRSHCESIQCCQ